MVQSPTDIEFVGAIEQDMETLYELLNEEPGSFSSSDSSRGSHHPSRECFMTQTPEGHVESVSGEEVTPTNNPDGRSRDETAAPSRLRMEQLRARQQEIDEAGQGLAREYADINREIERRKDGGHARATARTVHQRILTDDGALPHFARASQNIAAATTLLHGFSEAVTSEDRRARREIRTLLERAAAQQAESSLSR